MTWTGYGTLYATETPKSLELFETLTEARKWAKGAIKTKVEVVRVRIEMDVKEIVPVTVSVEE